ncbi:MAG: RNA polymerase sigma factor [Chlorobiales bacterium]|nr:RNA polymerase sigma factor [Chlorobiales bacterium]
MKADQELIADFKQGNAVKREQAFTTLVRRHQEKIYWVCRRMLGSHEDADDVAQNVFVKVYKSLDGFNEDAQFYTWAYRIATNESINYLRSKKVRNTVGLDDILEEPAGHDVHPDHAMMKNEQSKIIEDAIRTLPEKQQQVFMMRYYDELSYEEIAESLGTSVGGLKANYFHAFKKIEEYLKKQLPNQYGASQLESGGK